MTDSLIEDYKTSLNELILNSRPIIDNLTTIAKENYQVADEILALIVNRIYQTRPDYKLYTLYLLDSICKTIGNPYNILVGDDLFAIFSHIFQLGSEQTRTSLIKVFETWKQTRTRGSTLPLFPPEQLDQIQTFLTKAGYPKKSINKPIDDIQIQLINSIDNLIPIFQTKVNMHPHDLKIKDRFLALNKLKALLSSQKLKLNELQAIQSQLNNIKEQEINSNSPPPASGPIQKSNPVDIEKCQQLFKNLINSGIVKLDQAPIPGSKPNYQVQLPKIKYIKPSNASNLLDEIASFSKNIPRTEYEKLKFNHLILLSKQRNSDFQDFIKSNKIDNSLTDLLYSAKSYKCGLCGKRFTTDSEGVNNKRLHLDWHFRINKKLSTNSNVQSRNWYLDDFEWVKFKDEELLEFATVDEKKSLVKDTVVTPTVVNIPFVIVPPNDNNMNNRCIFCRENIKASYNEDNGEWCWFNCIKAPGEGNQTRKIMHVSCFNEANKKRSNEDSLGGIEKKFK